MFLWHWIPDSPRWWLMRDEIVKAKNILLAAAEYNDRRKSVPKDLDYRLRAQAALSLLNRPTSSWFSLWSDGKSVVLMIALHTAWAVYVTNYNGMLLNIRAFDRKYLMPNTIIAGLSEIVGVLIAWIFIVKMPNSKWMCTGMFNIFTGIISSVALYIDETECKFILASMHILIYICLYLCIVDRLLAIFSFLFLQLMKLYTWSSV